jgi:methyl-accepting chemotaxis protein/NO-binding membrane sensor protein with MHYT domain
MLKVLLCVTNHHDWRLVLVAAVVCLAATQATFFLYSRVPAAPLWRRLAWLSMTGLVAGSGIWTTHFVAMIAFETGLPTGYAALGTLGSLALAVVCTAAGFGVGSAATSPRRQAPAAIVGGLIVGLGITLMHYVGMSAYRTQGVLEWSAAYVAASVVIGAVLAAAALFVSRPGSGAKRQVAGGGLLTLGIVGMHFTGMTAVAILPDPGVAVPASVMSNATMIVAAVAVTAVILVTAIGGVVFDAASRNGNMKRLREALDAMPDGLAFYDANDRLTAWNTQYADLCSRHDAALEVGLPFADLIKASIAGGGYLAAVGREAEWLAERLAARKASDGELEQQTADGRWLRVTDRRTGDGGVVSVCVDITGLKRAETAMARARDESEAARREHDELVAVTEAGRNLVVSRIATGLAGLSDGDLSFHLNEAFTPEFEKLRADFNAALKNLRETMTVIKAGAVGIRSSSEEVSQASEDLSRRTEKQAASLEQVAAALERITETVQTSADGARQARAAVAQAKANAERSGAVVRSAVEAMGEIERSARQISDIIGVMDEIAFQTNLLALNAGVEAARAGEAGRGFAVVAQEVRALAQRSAVAAKEIKVLISASGGHVGAGVSLVGETGKALELIAAQVGEVSAAVGDIAQAAEAQAEGLLQINASVSQMDKVTQQNAAMAEEITASGCNLAQETNELARLIGRFKLSEAPAAGPGARDSRAA